LHGVGWVEMALVQNVHIARDKYSSKATQAQLHQDVQEKAQTAAELNRARANQRAMEAALGRQQAVRGQEIAQAQYEYEGQEFQERKIDVLLQGFTALGKIFHNITYTAAIIMGFAASVFVKEKIDHTYKYTKLIFWSLAMCTIILFVHAVFVASLAIIDGTKLAYQGTRGLDDVRRAFHGLMARRSEVFWNYMAGFVSFLVLLIFAVWCKLDQATGEGGRMTTGNFAYGGMLSFIAWFVPIVRMVIAFREVRHTFRIDYSGITKKLDQDNLASALDVKDDFSRSLGPQSVRRREEAKAGRREGIAEAFTNSTVSPTSGVRFNAFTDSTPRSAVTGLPVSPNDPRRTTAPWDARALN